MITKRINNDYYGTYDDTSHSFYVGSHGRGTDISTSDIDVVVVLPYSIYCKFNNYSWNKQSAFLQDVRNVLRKTYSTSDVSGDGQVIVIKFSDGMKFEIVPAFLCDDGTYCYANSNNGGSWEYMDPKTEITTFNQMNNNCNKNLKELCKMIREWNRVNNVGMSGILIDVTCYRFLSNYIYKDKSFLYYDYMTRDYFKYLYENADQKYWIVPGSNWHVTKKNSFKLEAKKAYELAVEAISDSSDNYDYTANRKWEEIYGSKF